MYNYIICPTLCVYVMPFKVSLEFVEGLQPGKMYRCVSVINEFLIIDEDNHS